MIAQLLWLSCLVTSFASFGLTKAERLDNASCTLQLRGPQADAHHDIVALATLQCDAADLVQVEVAPALAPFVGSFVGKLLRCLTNMLALAFSCEQANLLRSLTCQVASCSAGVTISVIATTPPALNISDPALPMSGLIVIRHTNLLLKDSLVTDLHLTNVTASVVVESSSLTVSNSTFNNTAPIAGGIAASNMQDVTVESCVFAGNYGRLS